MPQRLIAQLVHADPAVKVVTSAWNMLHTEVTGRQLHGSGNQSICHCPAKAGAMHAANTGMHSLTKQVACQCCPLITTGPCYTVLGNQPANNNTHALDDGQLHIQHTLCKHVMMLDTRGLLVKACSILRT